MRESGLYKWGQDKSQLVFDEKGKIIEWTFERWLETEHQITDRRGQQLMRGVTFIRKLSAPEANENAKIVRLEKPVLPSSEWQIRPLLTDLSHDGERIHVWAEVANSGEKKITAELVQRKGYSCLPARPWGLNHFAGDVALPAPTWRCCLRQTEHQVSRSRGFRLMDSVGFVRKLTVQNVAQNAELGNIEKPVLPSNERQIRPLLTDLQHRHQAHPSARTSPICLCWQVALFCWFVR